MPKKAKVTENKVTEEAVTEVAPATEATTATPEAAATADSPTLTLADIKNAVNVIDYLVTNGGLKGWDVIQQVSAVRVKLANFVDAVSPKTEEGEGAESAETETTGSTETTEASE